MTARPLVRLKTALDESSISRNSADGNASNAAVFVSFFGEAASYERPGLRRRRAPPPETRSVGSLRRLCYLFSRSAAGVSADRRERLRNVNFFNVSTKTPRPVGFRARYGGCGRARRTSAGGWIRRCGGGARATRETSPLRLSAPAARRARGAGATGPRRFRKARPSPRARAAFYRLSFTPRDLSIRMGLLCTHRILRSHTRARPTPTRIILSQATY
ncbi:hypothetical protein EVAR_102596_1 [Eumeta japonica]|uniref:Uncharacterized protein n=1 Tax=Eumeta variegata TaxID=151549 RepID=A0A4C1TV23_EUMVA|nr:hypothetical protein EVAR_102596_1 [Eumeta japonica]